MDTVGMIALPTFRQLQYLAALADRGSFSGAAQACHITQSTLSSGIKELETLLRQTLIDRSHKGARLTPFGEDVLARARSLIMGAEDIVSRARARQAPLSGPLRLGIIPTLAPYLLPRLLPGLRARFPALELQLHEDLSDRIAARLNNGALDAVLLAFPFEMNGVETHIMFSESFMLACPEGRFPGKTSVTAADLEGEELLLLEDGHCLRDHALAACRLRSHAGQKAFSATSLPTLIQMVRHGYGVTLLPEMAADRASLPAGIDILPFKSTAPGRNIGLAWRKGSPRAGEFRLLGQAMEEIASKPKKR